MTKTCVGAVIVTYNPNEDALERLLEALRPQIDFGVIIDNGSANSRAVSRLAGQCNIDLIESGENAGIAAAQNLGIVYVLNEGADYVLLSDQDSVPAPDMVAELLGTFTDPRLTADGGLSSGSQCEAEAGMVSLSPVAAVGPVPTDERGDSQHALVYSFTKWGPKRRHVPAEDEVLAVPFVLASGCLISRAALLAVGPMNESLFIDHVDLAWCLRAIEAGYQILVNGSAHLAHSLGEDKATLPWGREVHVQSAGRNYYMVRNTLWLERASFMPRAWKAGYLWYLAKYLGFYSLVGLREPRRWRNLVDGLRDGLTGQADR